MAGALHGIRVIGFGLMSMQYSPVNAVLWLTQTVYSSSGAQHQAMVIRDVCPRCQSSEYKKNGHIYNGKQNH